MHYLCITNIIKNNTMKMFPYYWTILLSIFLMFSSCKEEKYLNVNADSIEFEGSGGVFTFSVSSNDSWSISLPEEWASVSPEVGSGDMDITVTAKENKTYDSRSTEMIVIASDGSSQTVSVCQKQNNAILTSKNEIKFSWKGGAEMLEIKSNVELSLSCSEEWVNFSRISSKSLSTDRIEISVDSNESEASRNCTVNVKGEGIEKNISIMQEAFIPLKEISFSQGIEFECYGKGTSLVIIPIFYPENASDNSLAWSSSNESIAEVSENGEVITNDYGDVTISAKNERTGISSSILLHVAPKKAESMTPTNGSYEIHGTFGYAFIPSFMPYPEDSYLGELKLTSDNPNIVSVSDGKIVCNSSGIEGKAKILIESTYSGISSFLNVNVANAYADTGIGWITAMSDWTELTMAGVIYSDNPNDKYIITGIYYTDENYQVHVMDINEGLYSEGSNRVRWESSIMQYNEHYNSLRVRSSKWKVYITYTNNGVVRNVTSSVNLGTEY